jgi:hypothetical protein
LKSNDENTQKSNSSFYLSRSHRPNGNAYGTNKTKQTNFKKHQFQLTLRLTCYNSTCSDFIHRFEIGFVALFDFMSSGATKHRYMNSMALASHTTGHLWHTSCIYSYMLHSELSNSKERKIMKNINKILIGLVATATLTTTASAVCTAAVDLGGQELQKAKVTVTDFTATTTLTADHTGAVITMNSATAQTVTLPASPGTGYNVLIVQKGAGDVTIAGCGTIISTSTGRKIGAQYGAVNVVATTATECLLSGSLKD